MKRNNPLFSILLPTYNRASLLPISIKSILQQTFEDFELIICNSASPDTTRDEVAKFTDERINYIETAERLSMGENYDHALNQAKGKYIIFFSDDDAFVPTMLERIYQIIIEKTPKMIVFPFAYYHHENSDLSASKKNSLSFSPFTGKIWSVKSTDTMRRLFYYYGLTSEIKKEETINPLIGNIVVHSSVIKQIKSKVSRLFATIPVDIYFIILVLSLIDDYLVFDVPLLVWSQWENNSSVSNSSSINLRQHYEKLLNGEILRFVPLKFALPLNCSANAVLQAKADIEINKESMYPPVDWARYFTEMYKYLLYLQGENTNVEDELKELKNVLKTQSPEIQRHVRIGKNKLFLLKQKAKKKMPSVVKTIKKVSEHLKPKTSDNIELQGNDFGFNTVLQGANYLDTILNEN